MKPGNSKEQISRIVRLIFFLHIPKLIVKVKLCEILFGHTVELINSTLGYQLVIIVEIWTCENIKDIVYCVPAGITLCDEHKASLHISANG